MCIEARRRIHVRIVRVIERVVELRAQLRIELFLEAEVLMRGEVPVVDAGQAEIRPRLARFCTYGHVSTSARPAGCHCTTAACTSTTTESLTCPSSRLSRQHVRPGCSDPRKIAPLRWCRPCAQRPSRSTAAPLPLWKSPHPSNRSPRRPMSRLMIARTRTPSREAKGQKSHGQNPFTHSCLLER